MVALRNIAFKEAVRGLRLGLHTGPKRRIIVRGDQNRNNHDGRHHDGKHKAQGVLKPPCFKAASAMAEYGLHA